MSLEHSSDRDSFAPQEPVAEFLGLSVRTMERLRLEGRGPVFRKFGRRVMYQWRDVLAWADAHRRTSTSDSGASQMP
jgi:hypothetical protein